MAEAGRQAESVEQAIMGCVLPAEQGQAPRASAALGAGLHASRTGATTVKQNVRPFSGIAGRGIMAHMTRSRRARINMRSRAAWRACPTPLFAA